MTNFKLTPTTKHYVNAGGDRCEAALLNRVWVAVWEGTDKHGYPVVSTHKDCGTAVMIPPELGSYDYNITAEFTGWLSDPFAGAPEWVKYATQDGDGDGDVTWWSDKPYMVEESQWWDEQLHVESLDCGMNKYQGDWRNSLTCREDWQ